MYGPIISLLPICLIGDYIKDLDEDEEDGDGTGSVR